MAVAYRAAHPCGLVSDIFVSIVFPEAGTRRNGSRRARMQTIRQRFYGWKVVAASAATLAVVMGMYFSTNSLFVIPVCAELGLSRSAFTLHRTILTLTSACTLPFYGKAIARVGTKKTMLIGAVALSLAMASYSSATAVWHFYALAFINGVFLNTIGFMVIGILISHWFDDKRGLATGLAYAGSGLGGTAMVPLFGYIIELAGWRFAYTFMGLAGLAILLPVIWLFIKETPEMVGQKPLAPAKADKDTKTDSAPPAVNLSASESRKTSRFWFLAIALFLVSVFAGASGTHSAPFLSDIGYPIATISTVISLMMVFLTVGKITLGIIYDRLGTMAGNLLVGICSLIFPVAALLSHISVFPWIYAIAVGTASCGLSVPVSILIPKYFGMKDYAAMFGIFTMITTLGPSISVPVMGAVYDCTGSYQPAWLALLAFSVVVAICLVAAEKSYRKMSASRK